jgi:SprT-like family
MDLNRYFLDAFKQLGGSRPLPDVEVRFYPYAGLHHTIRIRSGRVDVRLSDLCQQCTPDILRALAFVLVARLLARKGPEPFERLYRDFTQKPEVMRAADLARRRRGHKFVVKAKGKSHDLNRLFRKLNRKYFDGRLLQPTLTWSRRRTKSILGHHDRVYNTITISKTLDSADVPEWLVEFILYHEMLHIKHPARLKNGRRYYHTSAFRLDERRFPRYEEAQEWLERVARSRKTPRARAA